MTRIEKEKQVVSCMIEIYCKKKHHTKELCPDCKELNDFALKRLSHCRYGETKGFCSHCKTHCYPPKYRERIKEVMRFSGPRLLFSHPIMLIRHILDGHKKA